MRVSRSVLGIDRASHVSCRLHFGAFFRNAAFRTRHLSYSQPVLSDQTDAIVGKPEFASHDEFLRLTADGETHDFHWFWLLHNCPCTAQCNHAKTGERIVDASKIDLDVVPESVELKDDVLSVSWGKGHVSDFPAQWLVQHSYAVSRQPVSPPPADVKLIEIDFAQYKGNHAAYQKEVQNRFSRYGAALVRNRGMDTEDIISDLLPEGVDVWHSHFGRIEDLKTDNTTNVNTDQLGYTNDAVEPHTDQPFVHNPPDMQALHGIHPADKGGDSQLVDARAAAAFLRQKNPWAFDMLRTIPVTFHRVQQNFESKTHYPVIQTLGNSIEQIRYSYFTMAPFRVSFDWMKLWYKAYAEYASIVQDPRFQYKFLLQPGDFILYSNKSMLHARTSFQGSRHVRGVYFHEDDVMRHLNSVKLN